MKKKKTAVRTLYRPMGLSETVQVLESGHFPPRRPEQPIFYPVLSRHYAEQIAERWNAPDAARGNAGFVVEFQIDAKYASRYKSHVVGSAEHRELWVPAGDLEVFNRHIVGPVTLVSAYYSDGYMGPEPKRLTNLKGLTARDQLPKLKAIREYSGFDLVGEMAFQRVLFQLNFAFWVRTELTADDLPDDDRVSLLQYIAYFWHVYHMGNPLVGEDELRALAETLGMRWWVPERVAEPPTL